MRKGLLNIQPRPWLCYMPRLLLPQFWVKIPKPPLQVETWYVPQSQDIKNIDDTHKKTPCRLMALDMGKRGRGGTSQCCLPYKGEGPANTGSSEWKSSRDCGTATGQKPALWEMASLPRLSPFWGHWRSCCQLFHLHWLDPASEINYHKPSPGPVELFSQWWHIRFKTQIPLHKTTYTKWQEGKGLTITC